MRIASIFRGKINIKMNAFRNNCKIVSLGSGNERKVITQSYFILCFFHCEILKNSFKRTYQRRDTDQATAMKQILA